MPAMPPRYSRVPFLLHTKVNTPIIHLGSWGFIIAMGKHCGRNHCPHCVLSQEAERAKGWAQVLFFPSSPELQPRKWFHPPFGWVFPSLLILSRKPRTDKPRGLLPWGDRILPWYSLISRVWFPWSFSFLTQTSLI